MMDQWQVCARTAALCLGTLFCMSLWAPVVRVAVVEQYPAHDPLALNALESSPLPCGPKYLLRSPARRRTPPPVVRTNATARHQLAGNEGGRCTLMVVIGIPRKGSTFTHKECSCGWALIWETILYWSPTARPPLANSDPTFTEYGRPWSDTEVKVGPTSYRWTTLGSAHTRSAIKRAFCTGPRPRRGSS